MLPDDQNLPTRTDEVEASDYLHSELNPLEQSSPDDLAIDVVSVTRSNGDQDRDHPVGLRTESTSVAAQNTDAEDEHRTGTSLGNRDLCLPGVSVNLYESQSAFAGSAPYPQFKHTSLPQLCTCRLMAAPLS